MDKSRVIVIDCFKLVKGAGKSIGIYNLSLNLVRNLSTYYRKKNQENKIQVHLIILGNQYNRDDFEIEGIEFVQINHNPYNKITCILWELFLVTLYAKRYHAYKIVFPRGFAPIMHMVKQVIIIHDLIPFYYNENYKGYFNRLENAYIMWRLKASIFLADQVITISKASKNDILQRFKVNKNKITVIYNGCNKISYENHIEEIKDTEPYILAVTSGLPHKNADGVIRTYEEYCKIAKKPLPIKMIGIDISKLESYSLSDDIMEKITCYKYIAKDIEMHQLIAKASCFLFLSLVEGFGFPPIEAMQLKVPVICSKLSSLPEVVGNAAVLVDPTDAVSTAQTIDTLLKDKNRMNELVVEGLKNVTRFDWETTVKEYDRVLQHSE